MTGRPSKYSVELADEICRRLAEGESLNSVCKDEEMPDERTVRDWVVNNREGFSPKYTQAREAGYLKIADELLDIADDGRNDWEEREVRGSSYIALNKEAVERSKLRVETRKWLLSKMLPKVYGDKVTNEITGALAVTNAIDAPPQETREEWIARRKRELSNGATVALGAPARTTNGRNHS